MSIPTIQIHPSRPGLVPPPEALHYPPYQCLQICHPLDDKSKCILFAASASQILSIRLHDGVRLGGSVVSIWPERASSSMEENQGNETLDAPPGKKRKLDVSPERPANVTKLLVSPSNRHLVAVTGEDKCVRVFAIRSDGKLEQLSERCMPKRPCAITLTSDGSTILCGDKFGDVYALPLLPSPEADAAVAQQQEEAASKSFVPSATNLTVHSGRNLKALENQLKSAEKQQTKTKEPLKFAHELLLAHVSMLTDIAFTILQDELTPDGKPRSYILTADRDEHIRISRGPPQAHVIESYCLGHKEFVSKLCLPSPDVLVSGGGDDDIFIWDWANPGNDYKIVPLKETVKVALQKLNPSNVAEDNIRIAVSGIWAFRGVGSAETRILVACESVPACFSISIDQVMQRPEDVKIDFVLLHGNVLDVAVLGNSIIASVDNVHMPFSASVRRRNQADTCRLQAFEFYEVREEDCPWKRDEKLDESLRDANNWSSRDSVLQERALTDLLYGIESLRKRGGEEQGEVEKS